MYLIDTHTLLWALLQVDKLSEDVKDVLSNSEGIYVSIVSLWEIAIKQSIGKLDVIYSLEEIADECVKVKINIMQIHPKHLDAIKQLPHIHNDPFDRLLIAQAKTEGMKLITKDGKIAKYDIETVW